MTYILVENVKNWQVLCKLFLISKCSAWSANLRRQLYCKGIRLQQRAQTIHANYDQHRPITWGKPQEGQIKWKKHKKSWPFPKLIFCHQWSLLDWTRMIQALFCVPGPHRGRGGPILGFGGPEGSKIWNFQTGPLLTVRCNFFDLNSL